MSNKLCQILVLFVLTSFVSAVPNARCVGNVLEYYGLSNNVVKHDCSILHASNGLVFRGECKTYNDGEDADCWRTEGNVTFEYKNTISRSYNFSNQGWDPPYLPPKTTVTITTIPVAVVSNSVQCPVCQACLVCDCSSYKNVISSLNASVGFYKSNADAYRAQADSRIDKAECINSLSQKDKLLSVSSNATSDCIKEKSDLQTWNDTYLIVACFSVFIMLSVVYVWVRYEYLGMKLDDPFSESKKKR